MAAIDDTCETISITAQDFNDSQSFVNKPHQQLNIEVADNLPLLHIKISDLYPCVDMITDSELHNNWFDSYTAIASQPVYDSTTECTLKKYLNYINTSKRTIPTSTRAPMPDQQSP